jgi:hypothetical protein
MGRRFFEPRRTPQRTLRFLRGVFGHDLLELLFDGAGVVGFGGAVELFDLPVWPSPAE